MSWWRWLTSKTYREATDFCRQARRLVNEQRDLLTDEQIRSVESAGNELELAMGQGAEKKEIRERMAALEQVASEQLLHYPHPAIRENVKEALVAVVIILGLTTFFLQLTKIPTGSMQPTLYGITYEDWSDEPEREVPGFLGRMRDYWFYGVSYPYEVAQAEGRFRLIDREPRTLFPFIKKQRFAIGDVVHTVWFPPEDLFGKIDVRTGDFFREGDVVLKMKATAGDHLLVDRFTYNFRRPELGEIIVFKTRQIEGLPPDQLYIKRLVALGGDEVRVGDDQHLILNGERLDASTPHFEHIYTFDSGRPHENRYFGHVNNRVARRYGMSSLAPLFPSGEYVYEVPSGQYLAMGDNTLSSSDSRNWGGVPEENVVGRYWFVYWPFTERFGWSVR